MTASPLHPLGVSAPVLAAPMAGGPTTPALVVAAARAGGLGFLAGGYRTAEALATQIAEVRAESVPFGVNLFVPHPVPIAAETFARYARAIAEEGRRYGLDLTAAGPREDDDHWAAKLELLLADPVPVVSFTFAVPEPRAVAALRRAGSLVVQTVTSVDEARAAERAGVDLLAVQAEAAGGHSGTFTPDRLPPAIPLVDLVGRVRAAVRSPLIAAGGLATADAVASALRAGAAACAVGTVLLRSDEAGTSAVHRAALVDPVRRHTLLTRAFTGRPARALANRFTDAYSDIAPVGYPALHHLTSPLRTAAAAASDPEVVHLWAGTGYRHAGAEPAGAILTRLAGRA